jgi:hypothetical protein
MNTQFGKLATLVAAGALAACSTVNVTTDYDHTASFAKYKTFAYASAEKDQSLSPSGEAALRGALRTSLAARGISEVPQAKADLDVVRHVFLNEKVSTHQYADWGYGHHGSWPYRYGTYGIWTGAPMTYTEVSSYSEGTLVLDFVDTHTKKLVYRGTGKAVVGKEGSNAGKIHEAVEKIVAGLPTSGTH